MALEVALELCPRHVPRRVVPGYPRCGVPARLVPVCPHRGRCLPGWCNGSRRAARARGTSPGLTTKAGWSRLEPLSTVGMARRSQRRRACQRRIGRGAMVGGTGAIGACPGL